jgi:hypothetical protein
LAYQQNTNQDVEHNKINASEDIATRNPVRREEAIQ